MDKRYRIKECFILQDVAGENVVIARGSYALKFGGILVLNDSCKLLWEKMQDYCTVDELSTELINHYQIEEDVAKNDVQSFIAKMLEHNLLETL